MRTVLLTLILLLPCLAIAGDDGESGCPAHKAAERGFTPFEDFHHVMAPAWHDAWPAKDYDALIAVGPKFEEAFVAVAKMEPKFKLEARHAKFEKMRTEFGETVKAYAAAAAKADKDAVYEMMPGLHDAFEGTAATLLPVQYEEIDAITMVMRMILRKHLPDDNTEGIVGSTETLVTKVQGLTEETIPEEMAEVKEGLLEKFASLGDRAAKMKECCDKKDMKAFAEHAESFQSGLDELKKAYL